MIRMPKCLSTLLALALILGLALPACAADTKGAVKKVVADKNEIVVTI